MQRVVMLKRQAEAEMMTFDYLWEEHSVQRNNRCKGAEEQAFW